MARVILHMTVENLRSFLLCSARGPKSTYGCLFAAARYSFFVSLEISICNWSKILVTILFYIPELMGSILMQPHGAHFCIPHCFSISITTRYLKGVKNSLAFPLWHSCKGPIVAMPIFHGNKETSKFSKTIWRNGPSLERYCISSTWQFDHMIYTHISIFEQ